MWWTNIMGIYVTHFCYSCLMLICFSGGIMISVMDARGHLCQQEVVHRLRHPRLQLQRGWKLDFCTILVSITNWIIHIDDPLFEFLMKNHSCWTILYRLAEPECQLQEWWSPARIHESEPELVDAFDSCRVLYPKLCVSFFFIIIIYLTCFNVTNKYNGNICNSLLLLMPSADMFFRLDYNDCVGSAPSPTPPY